MHAHYEQEAEQDGSRRAEPPSIPKELIDRFVCGPMSADAVNTALMALKKALGDESSRGVRKAGLFAVRRDLRISVL